MELMQASRQWASRPDDERFTSLYDMRDHFKNLRERSRSVVVSSRSLTAIPAPDHKSLTVVGKAGVPYAPTHHSFGQLAQLAEAPAGYLRTLPAEMAADCINYGLKYTRAAEEVGIYLQKHDVPEDTFSGGILRAATGPKYGRVHNVDVVDSLSHVVGDGIHGRWRVPGEFGKPVPITKANTTMYAGDRDMFVFLADEKNLIEVPGAGRNGETELLSRGFFVWNSEVAASTLGIASFLFRYVCKNRIVWGAQQFKQVRIRHTATAPDRWLEEVRPALLDYAESTESTVVDTVKAAQAKRLDDVEDFLAKRFGPRVGPALNAIHVEEEGRPIETVWDVTTAVTAKARSLPNQDERVKLERQGGDLLALAA